MQNRIEYNRRSFLHAAVRGSVATGVSVVGLSCATAEKVKQSHSWLMPIRQIKAGVLDVGYYDAGPVDGLAVILLHGFPYSIESYAEVAPLLEGRGCRVIVPHLRGHGSTRFVDSMTSRSGQQAAIGTDVIALMDSLKLKRAIFAGYDWGGRAACVAAAVWPERCIGLVSVNSYLIQNIAKAELPLTPSVEAGLWYQYYFQSERGRAGLEANRRELARTLWIRNSPNWRFDEATFNQHVKAFDNPDYVDVVIHSYRHRLGFADGDSSYDEVERQLGALPSITVPTITLDGKADGVVPANDGKASASMFRGPRSHRIIEHAGHNLPEEASPQFV